jgi:hypothetical protein
MQNRNDVIKDYLDFCVFLNRGNRKENESTEVSFEIEANRKRIFYEYSFYALVIGSSASQKIILCSKGARVLWQPAGFTRFSYLEEYVSDFLNKKFGELRFHTSRIPVDSRILKHIAKDCEAELAGLGIIQK